MGYGRVAGHLHPLQMLLVPAPSRYWRGGGQILGCDQAQCCSIRVRAAKQGPALPAPEAVMIATTHACLLQAAQLNRDHSSMVQIGFRI